MCPIPRQTGSSGWGYPRDQLRCTVRAQPCLADRVRPVGQHSQSSKGQRGAGTPHCPHCFTVCAFSLCATGTIAWFDDASPATLPNEPDRISIHRVTHGAIIADAVK